MYPSHLHKKLLMLWNAVIADNLPACTRYAQTLQGLPQTWPRADAGGLAGAAGCDREGAGRAGSVGWKTGAGRGIGRAPDTGPRRRHAWFSVTLFSLA
jgi:hypothetical protein